MRTGLAQVVEVGVCGQRSWDVSGRGGRQELAVHDAHENGMGELDGAEGRRGAGLEAHVNAEDGHLARVDEPPRVHRAALVPLALETLKAQDAKDAKDAKAVGMEGNWEEGLAAVAAGPAAVADTGNSGNSGLGAG